MENWLDIDRRLKKGLLCVGFGPFVPFFHDFQKADFVQLDELLQANQVLVDLLEALVQVQVQDGVFEVQGGRVCQIFG